MKIQHAGTILEALSHYMGDSHIRARRAMEGLTPEAMQMQYGRSGDTYQQVLDTHERHAKRVQDAIDYVKENA